MASTPDSHPDSNPSGPSEQPEQVSPTDEPGRERIEGVTPDREDSAGLKGSDEILAFENSLPEYLHEAGVLDGVSGTAGDVKTQDDLAL
jgi:hypothetical protein